MMLDTGKFCWLKVKHVQSGNDLSLSKTTKLLSRYCEKVVASQRFTSTEPLDLMKFICKEFWEEVFKRKVRLLLTYSKTRLIFSYLIKADKNKTSTLARLINYRRITRAFSFCLISDSNGLIVMPLMTWNQNSQRQTCFTSLAAYYEER